MGARQVLSCDFETTVNPEYAQVWLAGCYNIESKEFQWFRTIHTFFTEIQKQSNPMLYFHNLRFDGAFIIWYLSRELGYRWVAGKPKPGEYTTMISDMRQYYRIQIHWTNKKRCEIRDSLKIIRMPVAKIPKAFGLEDEKGSIEYETYTEPPETVTDEEIDYLYHDCKIVGDAIKILRDAGNTKLSSAANAMENYKRHLGYRTFDGYFPKLPLAVDRFLRKAYKGGYVYVPDEYAGKWCGKGFVVDVNSLYPSRCASVERTPLPYGWPAPFDGKPTLNLLYVVQIKCSFQLKPGYLPTIQLKNNPRFRETEYLKSSIVDGVQTVIELTLTNIDLAIMFEHYNITNLTWIRGFYFQSSEELWKAYVEENMAIKEQATKDGNDALRTIAKNNMNEPTGKFATRAGGLCMRPDYNDKRELIHRVYDEYNPDDKALTLEEEERLNEKRQNALIYSPMSIFITAWGRDKMIRTAQRLYSEGLFRYCDTDSAHCEGKMPLWLWKQCDHTKLGFWDVEGTFRKAKFLRPKTYMELTKRKSKGDEKQKYDYAYAWNIKCAGMPHEVHKQVTPQNFVVGQHFSGKLQQKSVPGGAILVDVGFTIQ